MTTERLPDAPMDLARLEELADRYGATLAHWPREEACLARLLLAESSSARAVLIRANRLDEVLSQSRTRSVSVQLRSRLIAAAPECGWRELITSLWPFGPVWRPATALVGIALVGIFLGLTDAAALVSPVSINGALSEEIQQIAVSVTELSEESAQWPK